MSGMKTNEINLGLLLELLCKNYRLWFDSNDTDNVIIDTFKIVIRRTLLNQRQRDVEQSSGSDSEPLLDSPQDCQIMTSTGSGENFILRATLKDNGMQESRCIVGNVLHKPVEKQVDLNIIQRIF